MDYFNYKEKTDFWSRPSLVLGKTALLGSVLGMMVSWTLAISAAGFVMQEIYQGGGIELIGNGSKDGKIDPPNTPELVTIGKYYALLIAVQNYTDQKLHLDQPIADAVKLKNVLLENYTFEPRDVRLLLDPDENAIGEALDNLGDIVTPNDNLLIFFAGHGRWEKVKQQGYWLPSNATTLATTWMSNDDIRTYIRGIESKHTLLISDACFSGGIFKSRGAFAYAAREIPKLHELKSRKAMTSGTLGEVSDQSAFLKYLTSSLRENKLQLITADRLFFGFRQAVINNSPSTSTPPQYGVIQQSGDEGGEFVFIRRDKQSPV